MAPEHATWFDGGIPIALPSRVLRITDLNGTGCERHLRVEGRIEGPQVSALAGVVIRALEHGARVRLDMSGVTFVDRVGVELLHVLRGRGVELRRCSTFIETLVSGER